MPTAPVPPPLSSPSPQLQQQLPDISDVTARLSTVERDRTDLAARIAVQLATTRSAVAARGVRTEGEAWSKAQLETSRLERLGNQAAGLYDRLDVIAGALAEAAVNGAEVAAPLMATGRAISQVRALEADVTAGVAQAGLRAP